MVMDSDGSREYRALFISDVHLGTRGCQAERLLDFLREYDAETIFLVGDIVDGWALRGGWYWPQPHNDVVQKLLRKARKGARIVYVPGNHDEVLRDFYGTHFGGIEVVKNFMHDGADGKRYLVTHGDQFDLVVQNARWLAMLGDKAYDFAIGVNLVFNGVRRRLGFPYWSLSKWKAEPAADAVEDEVDADGEIIGLVAQHREPARVLHHQVELVAVRDEIALPVGAIVHEILHDLDAAEMR